MRIQDTDYTTTNNLTNYIYKTMTRWIHSVYDTISFPPSDNDMLITTIL